MYDIVHIVVGVSIGHSRIIGVFEFDGDAQRHKALCADQCDSIEVESWIVNRHALFETHRVAPQELYEVGASVFYKDDDKALKTGKVVYTDGNQRHGVSNVMYRIERDKCGAPDYALGSDIIGLIQKNDLPS